MKIEWAMAVETLEIEAGTETIKAMGMPLVKSTITGNLSGDGVAIAVPVVIQFSADPTAPGMALHEFTYSYTVRGPSGANLGGRQTRMVLAVEVPEGWPEERRYPVPSFRMFQLRVAQPGPYEIEIWINEHRDEGVRLLHLVEMDRRDESPTQP